MPAHSHDGQIPTKAPLREPAKSRVTSRKQTGTDPFSQPRASQKHPHSQIKRAFSDETGGRVAGRLHWIHVACTETWTLFHLNTNRGRVAMDAAGVLPTFTGVAVHDGLAVYRQYDQAQHGLCNAHHLRG